ncbi:hypothetical protein [Mycobacteroides abscessus]|uniref:hypothetical protein n=1 Tax=Mycobacteroides abscessus TaxID=36809 RepID=UPI0019D09AF2|nr:hypothetical protein [Mycobacteroides abscessus]MBN7296651.1 hypothetical protein [Mycobacteroides abscessus subsp. abscessus]
MSDNENATEAVTSSAAPTPKRRKVIAAAAVLAALGVGVGGYALGNANRDRSVPAAAPVTAQVLPVLRSNDGTCGSRLDLYADGKVYALMLDGERDFRVLDITEESKEPGGGCSLGMQFPDGPRTEDSTGARSAKVLTGWDTQDNRCAKFVTIDGRRWILDAAEAGGTYLAHGSGRILAGDPRCGGELPMQPWGGASCPNHGASWVYQWDAARGECVRDAPADHRGEAQGPTAK